MDKWMWFLVSIGSIFIMLSQTEYGTGWHIILGLCLYLIAGIVLTKYYINKRESNNKKKK